MKDITIHTDITIRQAMKILDRTAEKCLLVIDENNKLLGTLTDGDLRRSILSGESFTKDISSSYNTNPAVFIKNKFNIDEAKQLLRERKLDLIPIVDQNNKVLDYITWLSLSGESISKQSLMDVPVVIMAGGKGTRLGPFTKILPKPLVPIDEKPIIEHIIKHFTDVGCTNFYMTLNYKGRILKAYFEELQPDYGIHFVEEEEPLGTSGSLRLLDGPFSQPFFVTNCDIIIKTDYRSLYKFHQEGGYSITLVASAKDYVIPYGTCQLDDDGHLSHINEKPQYDFLINTGLYVLDPDVLKIIPENKYYDMTHLIEDSKNLGKKVGVFPIDDESWVDVGQWADYNKFVENLNK